MGGQQINEDVCGGVRDGSSLLYLIHIFIPPVYQFEQYHCPPPPRSKFGFGIGVISPLAPWRVGTV